MKRILAPAAAFLLLTACASQNPTIVYNPAGGRPAAEGRTLLTHIPATASTPEHDEEQWGTQGVAEYYPSKANVVTTTMRSYTGGMAEKTCLDGPMCGDAEVKIVGIPLLDGVKLPDGIYRISRSYDPNISIVKNDAEQTIGFLVRNRKSGNVRLVTNLREADAWENQ